MKKIILLSIFIAVISPIYAICYSPDISVALGGNFTHYSEEIDRYSGYRASFMAKASINPLAMTIGDDIRISLPFSVDYLAHTRTINRLRIQERVRFSLDLKFDYLFLRYFGFSIYPGIGYTYFPKINAGSLFISLTVNPIFLVSRYFSISLPVKAIAATGEIDIELSVMCTVYPFGFAKGGK